VHVNINALIFLDILLTNKQRRQSRYIYIFFFLGGGGGMGGQGGGGPTGGGVWGGGTAPSAENFFDLGSQNGDLWCILGAIFLQFS